MALDRRAWWEARLLPVRIAGRDLSGILRLADRPLACFCGAGLSEAAILAAVVRATRKPWLMRNRRCLRQAVLAYRLLRGAGYRPELHFGVDARSLDTASPRAHCWIVLDGRVALNPPEPGMVTVLCHSGGAA